MGEAWRRRAKRVRAPERYIFDSCRGRGRALGLFCDLQFLKAINLSIIFAVLLVCHVIYKLALFFGGFVVHFCREEFREGVDKNNLVNSVPCFD